MMFKFSVTVPTTQKNGTPVFDRAGILKSVQSDMSNVFGGATSTDGVGTWNDDNGNLVTENVTVVSSFCCGKVDLETGTQTLERIARWVKSVANQDCVLITVEPVTVQKLI